MDHAQVQQLATHMAARVAKQLLEQSALSQPERTLTAAIDLIIDSVRYLNQPAEAARFALRFHAIIERWSTWGPWAEALQMLLRADRSAWQAVV